MSRTILAPAFVGALVLMLLGTWISSRFSRYETELQFEPRNGLVASRGAFPDGNAELKIELKNRTGRPIQILNTDSSCSCSVMEIQKGRIMKAGDSIEIPVRLNVPSIGRRNTLIQLHYLLGSEQKAVTIPISLLGEEGNVPALIAMPQALEISIDQCSNVVIHRFEVETMEHAADERWLTGWMSSSTDIAAIITKTEQIGIDQDDVARIRYQCEIIREGEELCHTPKAARITPVTRTEGTSIQKQLSVTTIPRSTWRSVPEAILLKLMENSQEGEAILEIVPRDLDSSESKSPSVTVSDDWLETVPIDSTEETNGRVWRYRIRIRDGMVFDRNRMAMSKLIVSTTDSTALPAIVPVTVISHSR